MTGRPDVERAVLVLRRGGLVAFPTETVYGLGADLANDDALRRVYEVKGRPPDHPLIVHVAAADALARLAAVVPPAAGALAARCWPGPLTLIVRAADHVSRVATGGLDTVAVRVPDHPVALELLGAFGGAVAAPSANRFGRVSPTSAAAVERDLGADVDLVLDGGACRVGVESTIVDCTAAEPRIRRPGAVTAEMLADELGAAVTVGGTTPAPGTLDHHYAPDAEVEVLDAAAIPDRVGRARREGVRVGVLGLGADLVPVEDAVTLAAPADPDEYARVLYAALREADGLGVDLVLAVAPPPAGVGAAIADRLRRAAAR